ncbi:MarR family winged helix-turn-helix transcriptional regulator [Microbacterium halophytorum]|uniref:MarR family winged helix-turn-helix transcriptional regulator n=1 Tax=Microbacterium halophytorum TaxID=2067568 RepID=UPI000CFD6F8D|nr:MarR family transcriptional regulator [Microbacterium halophytorum]
MTTAEAEVTRGSALAHNASFLLTRASVLAAQRDNRMLEPLGLKVRSYSVLSLAIEDVPPTQREIAEFLRLDPSQVVALVDELEGRGLVSRAPDPRDRRAKVVAATAQGRSVYDEARGRVVDVMSHLDPDDAATLQRVLEQLAFEE